MTDTFATAIIAHCDACGNGITEADGENGASFGGHDAYWGDTAAECLGCLEFRLSLPGQQHRGTNPRPW